MSKTNCITQDELKKVLHYNPDTGEFTWKVDGRKKLKGTIAGSDVNGYISISINKIRYKAHRLAWIYMYGTINKEMIDHINHDKKDNRIFNLREASRSDNAFNLKKTVGVSICKQTNKYRARLKFKGKTKCLGYYENFNDAQNAYLQAKAQITK